MGQIQAPRNSELHRRVATWFTDHDPTLRAQHLERAEDPAAPPVYGAGLVYIIMQRSIISELRQLCERR